MVLSIGVFLFNVMCALVPCDPKFPTPEIRETPLNEIHAYQNDVIDNMEPIVHLPTGTIEGHIMKSNEGRKYFAFQGIPYAESTAGERRWKPPVPKQPWSGVRMAKNPGPDCLQLSLTKLLRVYGSEDCLSISVYTPTLPLTEDETPASLPVVAFIHGGSFIMGGSSEYGASYMLNEDVVLVTMNYRLGALGFLSTGDEALPGNFGLLDQALALKWIHENIKFFGGNNKNVTLMGNSAGAASVNCHLIANKTRDYFSTAFSSSGTAFNYWGVQTPERLRELTNRLAERVRCKKDNSYELVKCLQRVDPSHLVAQQLNIFDWFPFPPVLFGPTVEPDHPDAFLTSYPEEAYKSGTVANKPYIIGATKDEGKVVMIILLSMMRMIPLRVMWKQIAPYYLQIQHEKDRIEELTETITNFYFKGISPIQANEDVFAKMVTDRYLLFGIIKGLQAHKMYTSAPTYFYDFTFREGNNNLANAIGRNSQEWGVSHGEDVFYFFNDSVLYNGHKLSDPDRELSSVMVKLLVNFAATGKPTYTSDTGEVFEIWETVQDPSKPNGLQFDKNVEMSNIADSDIERLNFWETLHLPNVTLFSPLIKQNSKGRIQLKFLA